MAAPVLSARLTLGEPRRGAAETARFARYIASRDVYKGDLVDELQAECGSGPALEVSNGFGGLGIELLLRDEGSLDAVCESHCAQALYAARLARHGLGDRCRLHVAAPDRLPFAPSSFAVVYSANALHEWQRPGPTLEHLARLVRPGGLLVVNDLRRDADPFIAEYVLRELAEDAGPEGRYRTRTFARSLAAAYSTEEARALAARTALRHARVEADDAMTLTVRLRIEGGEQ